MPSGFLVTGELPRTYNLAWAPPAEPNGKIKYYYLSNGAVFPPLDEMHFADSDPEPYTQVAYYVNAETLPNSYGEGGGRGEYTARIFATRWPKSKFMSTDTSLVLERGCPWKKVSSLKNSADRALRLCQFEDKP